jgi:hypothetical protein
MARSAALLHIHRRLKSAKSDDRCFFRSFFGAAFFLRHTPSQTRNARMGETTTAAQPHAAASSTLAGSSSKPGASPQSTSATLMRRA